MCCTHECGAPCIRPAVEAVKPTGLPLELVAKEYAEAWKALGGKASIIEAAKEFARRNLHKLEKVMPAWRAAQQAVVRTLGPRRWSAILSDLDRAALALNNN